VAISERGRSLADDVGSALRGASFRAFERLNIGEQRELRSILLAITSDIQKLTESQSGAVKKGEGSEAGRQLMVT
jgi:hypothetical protein